MEDACKRLWTAVLRQAITDAQGSYDVYRQKARDWLLSENREPHSFLWICEVLGLEPDLFRTFYRYE